jgi:HD-GYP domain-containing protein (c-di-GMP phosphodiesterase class II)
VYNYEPKILTDKDLWEIFMLSIKLSELREGMVFSKPLITEDGEVLLRANTPLKQIDINNFVMKGIYEAYSFGVMLDEGIYATKEERKSQIQLLKETLLTEIEKIKTDEEVVTPEKSTTIQQQELKLDRVGVVEQCVDAYTKILSVFNKSKSKNLAFIEKLSSIIKLLITEVQEHYFSFLDVITTADFGFHLTSHLVKTAIHAIYIAYRMDINDKRTYKIALGSLLHDIGKVSFHKINEREGINPTKEEMNLPVSHPVYGYRVAKQVLRLPEETCQIILNHHEQLDGKGFPRKVNSFKISQGDHICFIANFFENLIAKNGYEGYQVPLEQMEQINKNHKGIFEEEIVKILMELKER